MIALKAPLIVMSMLISTVIYAFPTVHLDKKLPQVEDTPQIEEEMILLDEQAFVDEDSDFNQELEAEPEENILDVIEVTAETDEAPLVQKDDIFNMEQQFLLKQSANKDAGSEEPSVFIPWIIFGVSLIFLIFSNAKPQFGKRK